MEYEDAIAATRAKQDELMALKLVREEFRALLTADRSTPRLRAAFTLDGDTIYADCFDCKVSASPRLVTAAGGGLAYEYAFFPDDPPRMCVWSFQLSADRTMSFVPATGFLGRSVRLGIDAPNSSEVMMLQLHGGVSGFVLVSRIEA
jgi:hypothetical protein